MHTDKELEDATQELAGFRKSTAEKDFLQRYADLLESYKLLKSDYEEEKAGRERYKQLARGSERNPFVLVLIDGDGYIFDDQFLTRGAEGGSQAAQHLNNAIKKSLQAKGLDNCEIVIRIYANLTTLSKILSKHDLAGVDKRSLSPFMANFNRSYGLTDFVDAGELKEGADFKIRALLDLYAENAQCKHIYFAACHDGGYISDLTKFRGDRNRVTLIRSSGLMFHEQFCKLDLGIEELPGVFRSVLLDGAVSHTRANSSADLMKTTPSFGPSATIKTAYQANGSGEPQKVCQYYQAGKCGYGSRCRNAHVDAKTPTSANSHKPPQSSQMGRLNNFDVDFTTNYGRLKSTKSPSPTSFQDHDNQSSGMMRQRSDPASQLPRKSDIPDGHVAVNKQLQRLDAYMPQPSYFAMNELKELSGDQKFCNNKQLTNSCYDESCKYNHDRLPEHLLPALEWLSRSLPCPKRGNCRNASCVLGHVCQNPDCEYRNGKTKCKLPSSVHLVDLTFDICLRDPSYIYLTEKNDAHEYADTLIPLNSSSHVDQALDSDPWKDLS
ncbi:hypothetical protein HD806DRAFT_485095 [Xylariaceae sp. AK1471]|nr:hypothetical protein HD806DRAFT_485095 [Xylariaceae sp. AK1471]